MADAFPFRLYGGATRPDAISGLNPAFSTALQQLYQSAPREVQAELGLNSAYRSPEVQARLYAASDKSGKWVAPPGKSKHNSGTAADLFGFGLSGGGKVSDATKAWVHDNAGRFGLYFPMSHEPWHVQLQDQNAAAGVGANAEATISLAPSLASAFGGIGVEPPPDTGLDMVASGLGDLAGSTQKRQAAARQRAAQGPQETPRALSGVAAPQQAQTAPTASPVAVLDEASLADVFRVADIGKARQASAPPRAGNPYAPPRKWS